MQNLAAGNLLLNANDNNDGGGGGGGVVVGGWLVLINFCSLNDTMHDIQSDPSGRGKTQKAAASTWK